MDISPMMSADRIIPVTATDKVNALLQLAKTLATSPAVGIEKQLADAILEREEIMSTGIGLEFAVPHAKLASIRSFAIAMGLKADGLEYGSLDKQPVKIIAMIAAPEGEQNTYLKVLKTVADVLKNKPTREKVLQLGAANDYAAIIDLFRE